MEDGPNVELVIDEVTNPIRTARPAPPPPATSAPVSQVQTLDDEQRVQVLRHLYPNGLAPREILSRVAGTVGNPAATLTDLIEKGLAVSGEGGIYRLTNLGVRNVRTYLINSLQMHGILQFCNLIQPYLETEDPWAVENYNAIMRKIIFHNLDVLYALAREQSLDEVIMSVAELRQVTKTQEPIFVERIQRLIVALESLNLVTITQRDTADYITLTDGCKQILYVVNGELEKIHRGEYRVPVATHRILLDETTSLSKKFAVIMGLGIIGSLALTNILGLELLMQCVAVVGFTVFLTLIYLYALTR